MSSRTTGRERIARVLRASRELVTVENVVRTLKVDRKSAAKLLARWTEQGWLKRVRRGTYAPVPLDARTTSKQISNPWVLVPALFNPGYVGGWSAAEHWEFTEQIFRNVCVFTARPFRSKHQDLEGTTFVLHRISEDLIFGTTTVWDAGTRISVSDPHRTIVDVLAKPESGGGIRHVADCLRNYLSSKHADLDNVVEYAQRFGSGAVFKRLGFLLEDMNIDQLVVDRCRSKLTHGYAKLDPALPRDRLVTRWRLWVPNSWGRSS